MECLTCVHCRVESIIDVKSYYCSLYQQWLNKENHNIKEKTLQGPFNLLLNGCKDRIDTEEALLRDQIANRSW